jgi:predicted dehydrogenase
MASVEEAEFTCVCDTNPATLQAVAEKYEVPGFATHRELLDSGLVDAILIATPHYFHPPIAIDAFKRGIHVLSEKPIGVTVGAADEMIAAAKASGCKFGVMFQMRTEPQNIAAKKLIDDGVIGEIYRTNLTMGWYRAQAYYDSGGWRATWAGEGGGVLINQAPHLLDQFAWLAGLPVAMTAQTRTRLHNIEVEDEAFAVLEYANGAHGYIYASTIEMPNTNRLEICGEKGKIQIDNGKLQAWEIKTPLKQFTFENESMWASPEVVEIAVELPECETQHKAVTGNFVRAILHGEPLIAPGEEGLNALELINGFIFSGKTQETVELPVDRVKYDRLIECLKASSKEKAAICEQIETDPNYT